MSTRHSPTLVWSLALMMASLIASAPASAMQVKVTGDQLVLTGQVVSGDLDAIRKALDGSSEITTVILRDSPGGDAPTGYAVGALFRDRGLRTAVSGYCYSSCSRMFLGGTVRLFTDDAPPEATDVGLHGHYDAAGHLEPGLVERLGLKQWIIRYSDGKADPALVERWINIPVNIGMIHFFHPGLVKHNGVSTFMCQGRNPAGQSVFDCEAITKNALDLGIITSLDVISSRDIAATRAAMPGSIAASGYAAIDDVAKLPVSVLQGRQEYSRFLGARLPRAFAVSSDGQHFAWSSGIANAALMALVRCIERAAGRMCSLYAVDDSVVWLPSSPAK